MKTIDRIKKLQEEITTKKNVFLIIDILDKEIKNFDIDHITYIELMITLEKLKRGILK